MMDLDRPHHRTTTTTSTTSNSELFICFTSRLSSSSSSMKISKSILSPGRVNSRDQPMSLPTSLSRRLRTNGSIKGGGQASPMFPNTSKKRGCGYENPEPSSPKVTCIGQVRVKTKKKAAAAKKHTQMRSLSRRRSNGGEASFRRLDDGLSLKCDDKVARYCQQQQQQSSQECLRHRNQRWVHLPLTICEALRAFGAEFSCLFPCGSWCFSTDERGKEGKGENGSARDGQQRSCGAVFARWLVTLQDGEGGKEREIELVVGEDEESCMSPRMMDMSMTSSTRRRHVLEDFDVNGEIFEAKGQSGGGDGGGCGRGEEKIEVEEEARASICVPPKNALLLMRCRSDPVKMAALTNRFWEAPPPPDPQDEVDGDEEDLVKVEQVDVQECREDIIDEVMKLKVDEKVEENQQIDELVEILAKEEYEFPMEDQVQDDEITEMVLEEKLEECNEQHIVQDEVVELVQETQLVDDEEEAIELISLEKNEEQESNEIEEECIRRTSYSSLSSDREEMELTQSILLAIETALQEEINAEESAAFEEETESITEKEIQQTTTLLDIETEDSENNPTHQNEEVQDEEGESIEPSSNTTSENKAINLSNEANEEKDNNNITQSSTTSSVLPDCLLLMMCEPKLSMEVSKETWVCSTDFIRCLPQKHSKKQLIKQQPLLDDVIKKDINNNNDNANAASDDHQSKNRRVSIDLPPRPPPQLAVPPRSSCTLPAAAAVSMASMIEQKLVNAVGYEPFVLTRCKSEPMRTAAAKLAAPDSCFWTKRKLEPLRRAAYQVGATGVGF